MTRRRGQPVSLLIEPPPARDQRRGWRRDPRRSRPRRYGQKIALAVGGLLAVGGGASIAVAIIVGRPGVLTGAGVEIPVLNISAPLIRLGRGADGAIQVPPLGNHNLAGWYDRTVTPGQEGTSVILGHVDNFTGPSVFFSIKTLRRGDVIKVARADGSVATFDVDGVQKVPKATFPSSIIYRNTRYPELRLITCGGPFDTATRQYVDNIVVYSHLIG